MLWFKKPHESSYRFFIHKKGLNANCIPCEECCVNTSLFEENEFRELSGSRLCPYCREKAATSGVPVPRLTDFVLVNSLEQQIEDDMHDVELVRFFWRDGNFWVDDRLSLHLRYDRGSGRAQFVCHYANSRTGWYGEEMDELISREEFLRLVHLNDITCFDDVTEENWRDYFTFVD